MMTKMLREHYNIIAGALHKVKPRVNNLGMSYWELIVNTLAEELKQTNPRFDHDRFIQACNNGVE